MHETSDFFLLCNNFFIHQVLYTLIYIRRSLYTFIFEQFNSFEHIWNIFGALHNTFNGVKVLKISLIKCGKCVH